MKARLKILHNKEHRENSELYKYIDIEIKNIPQIGWDYVYGDSTNHYYGKITNIKLYNVNNEEEIVITIEEQD